MKKQVNIEEIYKRKGGIHLSAVRKILPYANSIFISRLGSWSGLSL